MEFIIGILLLVVFVFLAIRMAGCFFKFILPVAIVLLIAYFIYNAIQGA